MITESLLAAIDRGREGKAHGYGIGLPKLEQVVDGVCKGVYTLIAGESGTGKNCRPYGRPCGLPGFNIGGSRTRQYRDNSTGNMVEHRRALGLKLANQINDSDGIVKIFYWPFKYSL